MLFNQTVMYALRAMAVLSLLARDEHMTSRELSEKTEVPLHYLSKVLRRLVLEGLLESKKGHGGGFSLSRRPEDITFEEVMAAVDYEPRPNRCVFGWGQCDPDNPCPLHPAFSKLNDSYFAWARSMTLAEVSEMPTEGGPHSPA